MSLVVFRAGNGRYRSRAVFVGLFVSSRSIFPLVHMHAGLSYRVNYSIFPIKSDRRARSSISFIIYEIAPASQFLELFRNTHGRDYRIPYGRLDIVLKYSSP